MKQYPEGYYSFKDGVPISDEEINQWIDRMLEGIEHREPGYHSYIGSGDTIVYVH